MCASRVPIGVYWGIPYVSSEVCAVLRRRENGGSLTSLVASVYKCMCGASSRYLDSLLPSTPEPRGEYRSMDLLRVRSVLVELYEGVVKLGAVSKCMARSELARYESALKSSRIDAPKVDLTLSSPACWARLMVAFCVDRRDRRFRCDCLLRLAKSRLRVGEGTQWEYWAHWEHCRA